MHRALPGMIVGFHQRRSGMPAETVLVLFAIAIPFALFAGVLAWVQTRTG